MATSGSTDFTIDTGEIIKEALESIGAIPLGSAVPERYYTTCRRSLNLMCKTWMVDKKFLWTLTEKKNVPLSLDQDFISFGPSGTGAGITMEKPIRIMSARLRDTTGETDQPLRQISREEYKSGVLSKTSTGASGYPTMFYYDSQRDTGIIYLNAVPDSNTINNYTLRFDYPRRIEDFDNADDEPDFLQEYQETITTNLAVRVRSKFPAITIDSIADVIQRANFLYQALAVWTGEPEEDLIFEPGREGW